LSLLVLLGTEARADPSLTSFSAGARVVASSSEYNASSWSAAGILDESPKVGWASATGQPSKQWIVVQLAEKSVLSALELDTGSSNQPKGSARHVTVAVSDVSAQEGFETIAAVELQNRVDEQRIATSAEVPGRWVRISIEDNYGDPQWTYLMDFRAYGKQLTQTALPDVSGTFTTTYGPMHLRQEGTSLTGCYGAGQSLSGGLDGKIMSLTWRYASGRFGPAMMVFSPDATEFSGYWWEGNAATDPATGTRWTGSRTSNVPGTCPGWSGGFEAELSSQLQGAGRSRVYGIQFDLDSDVIRPESRPTLDKIAAVLAANPAWRLRVEGHTDATGGSEHNLGLSRRRAEAVKSYLVGKGIDGRRLETVGLGASQPLAPNETDLGRAQNRRVELVRL
jgi:outer membrane protein OmpA-like peptidoglycan-associated protein